MVVIDFVMAYLSLLREKKKTIQLFYLTLTATLYLEYLLF